MLLRKGLIEKIKVIANRGECLLLYGPPGCGKTLLLQDLSHQIENSILLNVETFFATSQEVLGKIKSLELLVKANEKIKPMILLDHVELLTDPKLNPIVMALKALREMARHRIPFIFAADNNIKSSDLEKFGPLKMCLVENLQFIGPFDKADSELFTLQMANQFGIKLDQLDKDKIIYQSGGLARIIKRLIKLTSDGVDLKTIYKNPSLDQKLALDLEKIADFVEKNPESVFPLPLLENLASGKKVDQEKIGSIVFPSPLTRQEHALATCLIKNIGQLYSREELIKAIWPKNLLETSEHALDQMLHRLKKKLATTEPKCNLVTYRGRGCKLEILNASFTVPLGQ